MQVRRTWWRGNNDEFLGRVGRLAEKRKWGQLVKAFRTALDKVAAAQQAAQQAGGEAGGEAGGSGSKKQKRSSGGGSGKKAGGAPSPEVQREWALFTVDLAAAEAAATAAEGGFAFAFVEGALVRAVREGWWLLLDEMNLAPAEVRSGSERVALAVVGVGEGAACGKRVFRHTRRSNRTRLLPCLPHSPSKHATRTTPPAAVRNTPNQCMLDN